MEYQKLNNDQWLLRFERGEKFVEVFGKWLEDQEIKGGFFVGLGAMDQVEVAHYDVAEKKYNSKKFDQALEVTNVTGNIAIFEDKPLIHAHVSLSDQQMKMVGGHLVEGRISGTLEIYLTQLPRLEKQMEEETGLKVFGLESAV